MSITRRQRSLLLLSLSGLLGLFAVVMAESQAATASASGGYEGARGQLLHSLSEARSQGFTNEDLQPISERLDAISARPEPVWVGQRAGFYQAQEAALRQLRTALGDHQQEILGRVGASTGQNLATARSEIDKDQQLGVDDPVVAELSGRHDSMSKALPSAASVADLRKIEAGSGQLVADAQKAGAAQAAENAAIQQAADALLQQRAGNVAAIRGAGTAALATGRNEATIGAYEARPKRFAPVDQLMTSYNRLEKYGARLGSSDPREVSFAAAATQRYAGQVHDLVFNNLGPKHILVNWTAQEAYAYEGSKQVMDTLVTTGIRGVDAYGTDFGPMKVLHNHHPWTMHSPWPKESPFWYPDVVVQWTVFFTWTGESFHDADWEPDQLLGPGSQYNASTRSHGCIHLPYNLARWLYGWADIGTPVTVVPGDGQPLQAQLAEMTTDDQGNPGSTTQH